MGGWVCSGCKASVTPEQSRQSTVLSLSHYWYLVEASHDGFVERCRERRVLRGEREEVPPRELQAVRVDGDDAVAPISKEKHTVGHLPPDATEAAEGLRGRRVGRQHTVGGAMVQTTIRKQSLNRPPSARSRRSGRGHVGYTTHIRSGDVTAHCLAVSGGQRRQ